MIGGWGNRLAVPHSLLFFGLLELLTLPLLRVG